MQNINLESTPPVGRCVYCLRDDVQLSDEHIIPFGLSGTWVLPEASCQSCARITSAFERIVLRQDLQPLRAAGQFKTRRPKGRPSHLPLSISTVEGQKTLDLPTQDAVGFASLPHFDRAARLSGVQYEGGVNIVGADLIGFGLKLVEIVQRFGATEITETRTIHPVAFAQMIAKIGYCVGVATAGLDVVALSPVLDSILHDAKDIGKWVGSLDWPSDMQRRGAVHVVGTVVVEIDAEPWLTVLIKLFAQAGSMGYEVVLCPIPEHLKPIED